MLGIAVVSYNRINSVIGVLDQIQKYTKTPFELIVADDGSTDGSREQMQAAGHRIVSGRNMGVCWNKNRALFFLNCVKKCTEIILIEDDSWPTAIGWELDWITAIKCYGHVNLAGTWFKECFVSGLGTPEDPVFSPVVSGQCTGYSAEALSYVGYLDSRFQGYGVGHVEHSKRFLKAGYGGLFVRASAGVVPRFILLKSDIMVTAPESGRNKQQIDRNERLAQAIEGEPVFRVPWRDDNEMGQFRSEIHGAQNLGAKMEFDEEFYVANHLDVAKAISSGLFNSGEQHYLLHGQFESRLMRNKFYS